MALSVVVACFADRAGGGCKVEIGAVSTAVVIFFFLILAVIGIYAVFGS